MKKREGNRKVNKTWRYFSLFFVVALIVFFLAGIFGKPLLTAFVVSDEDYIVIVDEKVNQGLAEKPEVRAVVKLKEVSGIKAMVLDDIKDIKENIGEERVNYESEDLISADIDKEDLDALSSNPAVFEIKPVREISAFLQDSVNIVNASLVWDYQLNETNITGKGETICIIDTGVNFSHGDLAGRNLTCNIDCISSGSCVENCSVTDDHGHGTFVAGIAGASGGISGVAPSANFIAIKVLNYAGAGYEDDLKMGIDWCVNNSQRYNISVISMSLGTDSVYMNSCDNVDDAFNITGSINSAIKNKISVVAASGNQGNYTAIASPACITNVTAVGAVSKQDSIIYNRNSLTDLLAPGVLINSTTRTGGYTKDSGTSAATPFVSGAFALLNHFYKLQNNTQADVDLIEDSLELTGRNISDSLSGITYKRIDIYSALLLLSKTNASSSNETESRGNITETLVNLSVILDSPQDNSYTNGGMQNFSCSASLSHENNGNNTNQSEQSYELLNITLYVWNSTGNLIYTENYDIGNSSSNNTSNESSNETTNLTNTSFAQAEFTYNFSEDNLSEGKYYWNCLASYSATETGNNETNQTTNNSIGLGFADLNYSVKYDISNPGLTLTSPDNAITNTTSNLIYFYFSSTDNEGINSCRLLRNDTMANTKTNVNNNSDYFTYYLSNGNYNWSIICTDFAGNINASETRDISVSYNPSSGGGSGESNESSGSDESGGGGGGDSGESEENPEEETTTYITIKVSDVEAKVGYTRLFSALEEAEFNIKKDSEKKLHKLKINAIGSNTASITIQSTPQTLTLKVGEERNFSLEHEDKKISDFYVRLNNISNGKANITMRVLSVISVSSTKEEKKSQEGGAGVTGAVAGKEKQTTAVVKEEKQTTGFVIGWKKNKKYILALIVIVALSLFYLVFRKIRIYSKGRSTKGKKLKNAKEIKTKPEREEKISSH